MSGSSPVYVYMHVCIYVCVYVGARIRLSSTLTLIFRNSRGRII